MRIDDFLKLTEDLLPADTAMEGDRLGLQVQSGRTEIRSLMLTLEVNDELIDEAIAENCDCIVTFHPLIFMPMTEIRDDDRVGRLCSRLISNSIALISAHTNFDAYIEGTSKILADRLGLKVTGFLEADKKYENKGMGVTAEPEKPLTQSELLAKIYNVCNSPLRYSPLSEDKKIDKIAIVGGSGTSFTESVIECGAQAFITADVTYHKFHAADGTIMLIDPGHYETEQFVPAGMAQLLEENLDKKEYDKIIVSAVLTNPVRYYPKSAEYIEKQKEYLNNNKLTV